MKTRVEHMEFILNESTLRYTFRTNDTEWRWHEDYEPYFLIGQQKIKFRQAEKIDHSHYASGLGEGIRSHFEGFVVDGVAQNISFDTLVWVERNTMRVHLEWIPLFEEKAIDALFWPGEMSFDENRADWYTLLTAQQGLLIPNDWPVELEPIHFDGMFNTAGAYMPWYAQVKEGAGYLAVCTTPWDAGYQATHPESGGFTHVGMRFFKSLGSIGYRRQMYYEFLEDCDYTKVAKAYLAYAKETGRHVTLDEKRSKLPQIDELIGTSFVHMGIKTYVEPDSRMYDSEDPSKNNRLVPFSIARRIYKRFTTPASKSSICTLTDGQILDTTTSIPITFQRALRQAGGKECGHCLKRPGDLDINSESTTNTAITTSARLPLTNSSLADWRTGRYRHTRIGQVESRRISVRQRLWDT